ncbi:tumor necrosis factor receptor-like protein [Lymphocystis disease virus 4]|uniref:Tumor necrosis factor receptor-like protein n=1 Tax=Lymphocystis disease virus 4 TaxID=2704413 RepID=A0A6B9XHJ8_9VIRU|nr:tumor necrosis factor receptor-like protein [Lymphocystis disease virus 4]QHR78496.1 tumor necrosis factor receptor-like protein [Lymphocystis disease virus 4]
MPQQGHSRKCSDLTQKWDQYSHQCVACPLPGAGKEVTPNCGWDDEGGRHEGPYKACSQGTFNTGNSYKCVPCSACVSGYASTPCTLSTDTRCHKITTSAPITTAPLLPTPTQFTVPMVTNQTVTTSITVTAQYPSTVISHTIPISAGTFWGLAAMFMLLKQTKMGQSNPFHCGGDGGFSDNAMMVSSDFSISTNCTYAFMMIDTSSTIGVNFKQMDLSDDCNKEYVELFDGTDDKSLGKFCGKEIPPTITTTGSTLLVNFISMHSSCGSGGFISHYYQIK